MFTKISFFQPSEFSLHTPQQLSLLKKYFTPQYTADLTLPTWFLPNKKEKGCRIKCLQQLYFSKKAFNKLKKMLFCFSFHSIKQVHPKFNQFLAAFTQRFYSVFISKLEHFSSLQLSHNMCWINLFLRSSHPYHCQISWKTHLLHTSAWKSHAKKLGGNGECKTALFPLSSFPSPDSLILRCCLWIPRNLASQSLYTCFSGSF